MPKKTMTGSEMAARMTPEARTERARKAAMARHGTLRGLYAVVDRHGYCRNETSVYSAHATLEAARRRIRKVKSLMVIRSRNGELLEYGDRIYMDTIGTIYEAVA